MQDVLRVGIIGCGEVAQTIHLPTLRELPDLFEVTALCDVSEVVMDAIGRQWTGASRFTDYRDLLEKAPIDAVLVANHSAYHAATALDAMSAGKHVLLEKPMCINLQEADSLQAAEARSRVVVQIGFMRRYAPALMEAIVRLKGRREEITLARVHDVIGMNALIIDSIFSVTRRSDMPPEFVVGARSALAAATEVAIGTGGGARAKAYELLLGLGSHDISAMRELLGSPERVLFATQRRGGRVITAALDYGHYVCQYETAIDDLPRFDAHLEVYMNTEVLRVEYDSPYVRHVPARLNVIRGHGTTGISNDSRFATRRDSFAIEWQAFYENVRQRLKPKTTIADAREDLVIFRDMLALIE